MGSVHYASHNVRLEPERWRVRVDGEVVEAEPKVFEFLSYLMRHAGRVVSKTELLDSVWSGDVVGESVLTRCASCARKLLKDDSKAPRFIRTYHGRGYEFIAPVVERAGPDSQPLQVESGVSSLATGEAPEPGPSGPSPFVGRSAEVSRIKEAIRRIGQRSADFVLVTGEAGIGKTRSIDEALRGSAPGVEPHFSRCSALDGTPPFFPWRQAIRSIVRHRSQKTVLRAFGNAATVAGKLLLGASRWPDDELGWGSPSSRFRLFDSVAQGLAELARQRPMALVFDDLHLADPASLFLFEFLAQQPAIPMLLLGAVRDGEPVAEASRDVLVRLRAACTCEITLLGLSREEVGKFARLALETEREDIAESLFHRTGGNPFFLTMLTSAGSTGTSAGLLPSAVLQAASHRLSHFDAESLELLRIAAAYGSEFEMFALARAAGMPADRCFSVLSRLASSRVVRSTDAGKYRFEHDLLREVLYAGIDPAERSRVHLAIARALDASKEYQESQNASMLARHFVAAAQGGGATRAVDLSIRAGAYALRNFGYEEAIEHFTVARRLLPLADSADPATECAILLDLGLAQISAGQRTEGRTTLHRAAEVARELGAVEMLAAVALGLAPGLFAIETGVYDPALVGLLREALHQVGTTNDGLRALLLARLALALYWSSDSFEERALVCEEAEELARRTESERVKAAVTTARIFALLRPNNLAERREWSERAVDLSQRAADHQALLMNLLLRVAMFMETGDMAAAAFEVDAFRRLANGVNQPQSLWIVQAHEACRLLLDGRLDAVEELAGRCLQAGQRVHDHNALLTFGVHLTLVRVEQGRAAEILGVVRDYAARYPRIVGWRVLHAYALACAGESVACRAEYETLKRTSFSLPDDLNWMVSMAWLSHVCHSIGDAEGARVLYERLFPYADRLVVVGYAGIACLGSVERYLGLLAVTVGSSDAAEQHLRRAVAVNRRISATLPLAHSLSELARVVGNAGRASEMSEFANEALALALSRGLTALRARIPSS